MNRLPRVFILFCLVALVLPVAASLAAGSSTKRQAPAPQASATPARDEKLWKRAVALQKRAIVVDGHNDIPTIMADEDYDIGVSSVGKYHTDIARLKQGGMTGEFFSIYVDRQYATPDWVSKNYAREGGSARRALDLIDVSYRMIEKYPRDLMLATSTADIRRAKKEGKVGVLMGIEGGHAIENSLPALREFYRLGVRYMTLTHNNTNEWADACCDTARHGGLSEFGKEVVAEMNRLGMLVDVSHVSDETMSDVLDVSKAPVIASHSSARVFSNHKRNVSDELLKRIAQNGGVVMVNFYPAFLDEKVRVADLERDKKLKAQRDALREQFKDDQKRLDEELKKLNDANPIPNTTLSMLVDHIEHIAKVAGIDHVGLGSDFDGVPNLPEGIKDVADLPNITYELLRRGHSDTDVLKILGGNFMRVFAEAERVAGVERRKVSGEGSLRRLGAPGK
ncbi:MAG: rane dipeptidase [Acidobacteriota bacterium]|nr:rane dipeptidase [Acidobacteriota bacterium]